VASSKLMGTPCIPHFSNIKAEHVVRVSKVEFNLHVHSHVFYDWLAGRLAGWMNDWLVG
jgi:hypothetical protein